MFLDSSDLSQNEHRSRSSVVGFMRTGFFLLAHKSFDLSRYHPAALMFIFTLFQHLPQALRIWQRVLCYFDLYLFSDTTSLCRDGGGGGTSDMKPPPYHLPVRQALRCYTAHSLCTGAATSGATVTPVSTLKDMGHWSSAASERYLPPLGLRFLYWWKCHEPLAGLSIITS